MMPSLKKPPFILQFFRALRAICLLGVLCLHSTAWWAFLLFLRRATKVHHGADAFAQAADRRFVGGEIRPLRCVMDVLEVPTKISRLGKGLVAISTQKGSLAGVLSEMVPQIAWLFEDTATIGVHALEVQLYPLCLRIPDLYGFVPIWGNALESLRDVLFFDKVWAIWFIVFVQRVNW